jgi:hypothetical protein
VSHETTSIKFSSPEFNPMNMTITFLVDSRSEVESHEIMSDTKRVLLLIGEMRIVKRS